MPSPQILSRVFDRIPATMYHGTHSGFYSSLFAGINTSENKKRKLDFGVGFYLTSDFRQASDHAIKRCRDHDPIVFIYTIDRVELKKNFKGLILSRMDTVWAEFIYDNRSRKFGKPHSYDYVLGGVADGQLFDLLTQMDNVKIETGKIDSEYFLESIANYTYDQLSIHDPEIINQHIVKLIKVVKANDKSAEYIPA